MSRKRRTRRIRLSFAVTFGILVLVLLLSIALAPGGSLVVTKHIPANIPTYDGIIGDFAPSDATQVSYNNFTAIRAINQSALISKTYLVFSNPKINISVASLEYRVSIVTSAPNATVDVTILNPAAYSFTSSAFNQSGLPSSRVGQNVLFSVSELLNSKATQAWVTMLSRTDAFVSSVGVSAKEAIARVLAVYDGNSGSLISRPEVQRTLYVVNGTGNHLAIGIQNYAGAVTSGKMTLITVDKASQSLAVNYAVKFANSTFAQSQINYFLKVYIVAGKFASYDEILLATSSRPISDLTKAILLAG